MFLSYATVPMFAFMVLLNFFFLYSPVESVMNGRLYDTCQKCLDDTCHKKFHRPCLFKNGAYFCFTCNPENGNQKFYTLTECQGQCTDPRRTCVCADACYMCAPKGARNDPGSCRRPTIHEMNKCG
ncbi:unnamed protein product [Macrosiphum euphorbiae]|uniref:Uncharacterized protein n=1 Tax=Macrosiphum euphorbiae TaxID=13131 RepID=A0AAV0XGT7_9HEMI|nr:unnamed protein product [Macrosiphum euphorbiae]